VGFWVARHHIDAATYQQEFDANLAHGRMPICVRAAGRTFDPMQDLYTAVFAANDQSAARHWSTTGAHQTRFDGIEALICGFMQTRGIRAGTLALRDSHGAMYSRGYTFAESGYPICQPNALFRLASLSKLFTAAAIGTLQQSQPFPQNLNFLNKHIFQLLGITAARFPSQTPDNRINTITLHHLIEHQGGWVRDIASPSLHPGSPPGFDPCSGSALRLIGRDLLFNHVVSPKDVATYMYGEPLQFTPGTVLPIDKSYSNFGYLLLGLAVERISGIPYYDYLKNAVLTPMSVTDVFVANSFTSIAREVAYHRVNATHSVFRPDLDPAWVSEPYGGLATEVGASSGGLLASASAVVNTIAHHAVWGIGARAPGSARIGDMPGTFTCASSRGNGFDWAVLFNCNDGLNNIIRDKFLGDINAAVDALS
jgi:CubicO group peptidase (beta-lactamase class C family)